METISTENTNTFLAKLQPSSLSANSGEMAKLAESIALPTTRHEKWKYTRLGKIKRATFNTPVSNELDSISKYSIIDCPTLVFVNGIYNESLSSFETTDASVKLYSADNPLNASTSKEEDPFEAMNIAYLTGGAEITISRGKVMSTPLQVININTEDNTNVNLRLTVNADANSQGEILVSNFGTSTGSFTNLVLETKLGQNAHLRINKLQYDSSDNFTISNEAVSQDRDSVFTINTFTLNGGLVRNNLYISVDGENCESNLYGAYILKGNQHVDNHTVVDQRMPNCESNELYKGVMDEKSTAVFNGKVFVRKDAQKVNAFQSNGNVLLSDDATVNSKPELEIYADDVKCSHGSTTGQLDEEAVFYLRSRGLSENSARQLLVTAFIEDTFELVNNDDVVEYIHGLIKDRFGWQI